MITNTGLSLGHPHQGFSSLLLGCVILAFATLTSVQAADEVPKSTIVRITPGGFSPVPVILGLTNNGATLDVSWFGLTPPYVVESISNLGDTNWTAAVPGTNDTIATVPNVGDHGFLRIKATAPYYVGAPVCQGCHPGTHSRWSETRHAHALETLKRIGRDKNGYCLQCHTVGYGLPNGFISEDDTPWLAGVQCENCHGPGGNHVSDPSDLSLRPKIEMSAKVCGGCHSDAHHPTFEEWSLAEHSTAVDTIKNRGFARDSCLECHSQDYRFALENNLTPPTKEEAQLSIECSTCHSAHGEFIALAQLKKPVGQLCGECHTAGNPRLGSSPHHPQFQVLSGYGTFNEDGTILTNTFSTHSTLALAGGAACAQCHVVQISRENPNEGNPNVVGHTFNPFNESLPTHSPEEQYTGCADCHSPSDADSLRERKQNNVTQYLAFLAPFFDDESASYIDPAGLSMTDSNRLAVAKWNYQFLDEDKSRGIHNPNFYRASLSIASNIVVDLSTAMSLRADASP